MINIIKQKGLIITNLYQIAHNLNRNPIIIIPARMASTRLPEKPLASIDGTPMISHVVNKAKQANLGPVYVACDNEKIFSCVEQYDGQAILTDPEIPSGTDRIYAALHDIPGSEDFEYIINVQGDVPTLKPDLLHDLMDAIQDADMGTLITPFRTLEEAENPNNVKVVWTEKENKVGPCHYFSRSLVPANEGPYYHHIGLYIFKRKSLEKFVSLPQSPLEKREKLEQLRALENGMTINAKCVDDDVLGVDTPEDLNHVRSLLESKNV